MSLRELPPDQQLSSKWRRVRYVPLIILVILGLVATAVGLAVKAQPAPPVLPVVEPVDDADDDGRLPAVCRPETAAPAAQPWTGPTATAAEAEFASHGEEYAYPWILGQDGWVFWGDIQANNFSQAVGRRYLAADELQRWHDWFADLDARLTELGIELYIVISPAKWAVYPDGLPEWAIPLRGPGPLDQLMAASEDLPFIDLRQPLIDEAENYPTYSRVNSHWTDYGAYVAWNAIAECLNANDSVAGPLTPLPLSGVRVSDEFNEFETYGFESPVPDWTEPEFAEPLLPVVRTPAGAETEVVDGYTRTGLELLPATTETEGAQSDASVLFVRDSFGTSLSVYVQQAFAETLQVRHNIDFGPGAQPDLMTLANTYRPDVVVLQIAQRHLNFPPQP